MSGSLANRDELLRGLEKAFGTSVVVSGYPGGRGRKTFLCRIEDTQYAVSQRRSRDRARLEASILQTLGPAGLSPGYVLRDDAVVVQEFVEGTRLSQALDRASRTEAEALLDKAASALLEIQSIGQQTGLADKVPLIGARDGWTADLASSPARLAQGLGIDVPDHDFGGLLEADRTLPRVLNKWDARSGNAILRPDGTICWIDWEHAGSRRRLDDLVWLFADEWSPDADEQILRVLDRLCEMAPQDRAETRQQFYASAIAHSAIRMSLILSRKGDGAWWDHQQCLTYDRVGVTPAHLRRVATRAARWCAHVPGLHRLEPFFLQIAQRADAP